MFAEKNNSPPQAPTRAVPRLAFSFVPELDGVRGLACLMVVLYHAAGIFPQPGESRFSEWLKIFDYGCSGVDLFFVLSAYLLTRILLQTKGSPQYFSSFYGRRVLRIFPLYYLTLAAIYVTCVLAGAGAERVSLWAPHRYSLWLFYSNITVAFHGAPPFSTMHFWSLALEEQFYLFWPLVIALISPKNLFRIGVGFVLFSLGLRIILNDHFHVSAMVNRFLLPPRLDSFGMGAIIALLAQEKKDALIFQLRPMLFWTGLALVACAYFRSGVNSTNSSPFITFGLTGNVLLAGALICHAHLCGVGTRRDSVLSSWGLTKLGQYSYGIYVLHFPLLRLVGRISFSALGISTDSFASFGLKLTTYIVVSCVAGFLSWYLFERHFLRLKKYFPV